MDDQIFPNEAIATLYNHYHVEKAHDDSFCELFQSLADWLVVVDKKRVFIDTCVIRSDKAQILVIPNDTKTQFSLIWDISFWEFYEKFVSAFFSIMSVASDNSLSETTREAFLFFAENFFSNSMIDYLKNRFSSYKDICALLESHRVDSKVALLYIDDNLRNASVEVCLLGKEFVLMHELEHILYSFSPEVFQKDSLAFDEVLKWFHDELLPLFDTEIIRTGPDKLKIAVEHIQSSKGGKQYIELFNDYHAFFEVMLHHHENIIDTSVPFTSNSQSYFFGVKLLKMFESCINYLTKVVGKAASTKFQTAESRISQIQKTSENYQCTIFSRDYLSVELIWVGLYWYSQRFSVDRREYIESHDTETFTKPYTEVLEPKINSFVNLLIHEIIALDC